MVSFPLHRSLARLRWSRALLLASVVFTSLPAVAQAEFVRRIAENATHFKDQFFYSDLYSPQYNYTFGRSEGKPSRGPNPLPGPAYGSRDVDISYDLVPVIHQYYQDKFARNGPNGLGGIGNGTTRPHNRYTFFVNAIQPTHLRDRVWVVPHDGVVVFAPGYVTTSVVGHEMFHVVDAWRSGGTLLPLDSIVTWEAGALGEGLADFFGEAFERYVTGSTDWLSTWGPNNEVLRSLSDPPSTPGVDRPHIDRYLSPDFWDATPRGGSYANSGILSKAAYLASEGGHFNGYDVTPIGFDKVEQILYRAVNQYFTPHETFNGAYRHFLLAAEDLYGPEDVANFRDALQAVEMHLPRAVPEPSSFVLLATGIVVAGCYARKRRRVQRQPV